jgi:hypothetical protein
MNLSGFNYGFVYFRGMNVAFANPESPFGPLPFMAYAAEKIGCKISTFKDMLWDEAWKTMKQYVDRDIPVYLPQMNMKLLWRTSAQWVHHVIVLTGYDEEKGVVMVHDPASGEIGEGTVRPDEVAFRPAMKGKSGSYAKFKIEDFRQACDSMQGSPWEGGGRNVFCVVEPVAKKPSISWAEVLERNSKLTLGQVEQVIGESRVNTCEYIYGPQGIMELAQDLEGGFGLKEPTQLSEILLGLRMLVGLIGSGRRICASGFLAGLASVIGSRALENASNDFRFAALCYERFLQEIDSSSEIEKKLSRICKVLRRAAEYEKKAGENLSEGAQDLKKVEKVCFRSIRFF